MSQGTEPAPAIGNPVITVAGPSKFRPVGYARRFKCYEHATATPL
jgi:hypothetical protein